MVKRFGGAAIAWLALCSAAVAHPGHGADGGDFGLRHYLTEPAHLGIAIPVLLLGALTLRLLRRPRPVPQERVNPRG